MLSVFRALAGCAVLQLVLSTSALATAIYTYEGDPYRRTSGAYSPDMRLTGFVELAAPIAPSSSIDLGDVLSFEFDDGLKTVSSVDGLGDSLVLQTNALGEIEVWSVLIEESSLSIRSVGDASSDLGSDLVLSDLGAARNNSPGRWVPEPSAAALLGFGLVSLASGRKRQVT